MKLAINTTVSGRTVGALIRVLERYAPMFQAMQATAAIVELGEERDAVVLQVGGRSYLSVRPEVDDHGAAWVAVVPVTSVGLIDLYQNRLSQGPTYSLETDTDGSYLAAIASGERGRCPRCGSSLLVGRTAGEMSVWCTFVGGAGEPSCTFGIGQTVRLDDFLRDPKNPRRVEAPGL